MQSYPRLPDTGLLNDSKLVPHRDKISVEKLKQIVMESIETASKKSSRAILNLKDDVSDDEVQSIYRKEGLELFKYFQKYAGDPAYTSYQCISRHYSDVAREQFRNRTLQMERMNSAWTYQFMAKDAAAASGRFENVSDLGLAEADFNVVIKYDNSNKKLAIYISVKNRSNTIGGQDFPKAIAALEEVAVSDQNRTCDYICVFGITMERGQRSIRHQKKTGTPYSWNTEIWFSDFFWPFFTNYSYEEIAKVVLKVLFEAKGSATLDNIEIPQDLLQSFGKYCKLFDLIDPKGYFNNPIKLVEFFCRKIRRNPMVR